MKKKKSISHFAYLLYFAIVIALLAYIFTPSDPSHKKGQMIPGTTEKNNTTLNPKKTDHKEFSKIGFDERLNVIGAKIGDRLFIRIFKKESLLEVWIKPKEKYLLFKRYPICKYSGILGPKLKEGDKQAPEGFYKVTKNLLNPNSKYHLAFNLGYPNAYDRAHKRTGSYLMVHGECVSVGCYAMTNEKIEEIYTLVEGALKKGQKYVQVHAYPFYMTSENMAAYQDSKWYDFWAELKQGYDYFETEKLPPLIKVENRHYTIHEANE